MSMFVVVAFLRCIWTVKLSPNAEGEAGISSLLLVEFTLWSGGRAEDSTVTQIVSESDPLTFSRNTLDEHINKTSSR